MSGAGATAVQERTVRAAIYARISSDRGGDALGVKRQEKRCRELIERKGWTLAAVHTDNDRSAFDKSVVRESFERLRSDLDHYDVVVYWKGDRVFRNALEYARFLGECQDRGVRPVSVEEGEIDLDDPMNLLLRGMFPGAQAEQESRNTAKRTRSKHKELAEKGKDSGGPRPYGFERDRVTIREEEAEVLRDAARRVLQGDGLRTIVRGMNEAGVPTVTEQRRRRVQGLAEDGLSHEGISDELGLKDVGTVQRELDRKPVEWYPRVLRRMLLAPRTAGMREHHGEVTAEAEWDAILDEDTWEDVRLILTNPARRKTRPARKYLLTAGLLRCGRCGGVMGAQPTNDKRAYRCRTGPGQDGCGRRNVVAEPVEELVSEAVLSSLESQNLLEVLARENGTEGELKGVLEEMARVEERLKRLRHDHHVRGKMERAEFLSHEGAIEDDLRSLKYRAEQFAMKPQLGEVPAGDQLREWWAESGLNRRRELIRAVVERVVVNDPVVVGLPEFDPRRIDIVWRG